MATNLIFISIITTAVAVLFFIYEARKSTSKVATITPSLCVTIGIFFTFVGIAVSLQSLAPSSNSQEAFEALLVGLKSAFWSSVIGLGGSILCRWQSTKYGKDPYDEYAKQTNHIVVALRENSRSVIHAINNNSKTIATILSEQLFKDSESLSQQFQESTNVILKKFAANIEILISQSNTLLNDVNTSVQSNQVILNTMVTSSQEFNENNRIAMRNSANLLRNCVMHFNTILESTEKSLISFEVQNEKLQKGMEDVSSAIMSDFSKVQTLYHSLSHDINRVESAMKSVSQLVIDLKQVQELLEKDHKESMVAAITDFKVQFQNVSKEFDALNLAQMKAAHAFFENLDLTVEKGLTEVVDVYTSGLKTILKDNNTVLIKSKAKETDLQLDEVE
ncbi:hypothetical protein PCIT_b0408 [Pseudoalteromonas citrea]|uniref:MotA/TolQ/ExbB proton channel domain-containing protein n=2 Tax=Pseudoalteromonas citrea TaxID=43655 RepID=A0AAD4AED6_9GAMM|nr:hypothetical protein [Pseudoalteromonas citrea]KAF7764412.1 hypothetical protein PCIT_b0408 [Pseudoalteromonas citrea]